MTEWRNLLFSILFYIKIVLSNYVHFIASKYLISKVRHNPHLNELIHGLCVVGDEHPSVVRLLASDGQQVVQHLHFA